jgi:alpha-L-fucosidase
MKNIFYFGKMSFPQNATFTKPLSASSLVLLALACGQALAQNDGAPASIPYSTMQVISDGDSAEVIAEEAAKVLPRPNQTDWMRLEWTFFLHYGPNAFHGVEWGTGREEPSLYNPTAFDADQWVRAMKDAGGKMVVLVCKHHDGLCLWQTRYTPHSVAASPWLNGKGDEVKAVAAAAKKYGLKLGVYLSPADLYQLRTNPKNPGGYYGDNSSNVLSVIPTDPASFKSDPSKGRKPAPDFGKYSYVVDDYNRYFLNQLYELLTEFGPIEEVWFDGANPDPSVHETYNYNAWYDLIRHLQPKAVIMGKGPDVRWVGNEGGIGRTTEWSVVPLPTSPEAFRWPDMTGRDLGSRARLRPGSYLWWFPAEVNVTILANGAWFWAPQKHPRNVSELVDIYYRSIGRNGNLILNLSPNNRGLIPDDELEALREMSQIIKDTFAIDLARGGKLTADTSDKAHQPPNALDRDLDTWWEAAPGKTNAALTLTLRKPATFDVVSLQEAVDHRGQRIESFAIDFWNGSDWPVAEKISSDEMTTVGHRRLIRLKSPVSSDQVRIRISGSRLEPTLAEIGLFKQSVANLSPVNSGRDANRQAINKTRWKIVGVDSQETGQTIGAAVNAIDGNPSTIWQTRSNADLSLPHYLTIDMGTSRRISGFTYLPRQDGNPNGTVETYRFETSVDGVNWTTNLASGTFANIRNNPSLQEVPFAPVSARFFRFTALQEINTNGWTSAAEISVLPAETGTGH